MASIDNIWTAIVLFGLAIFFITLNIFWNVVYSDAGELWTGSSVGTTIRDNGEAAVQQYDWIFMIVWVGFHLGILVTAFLLRTHPVIYIVAIILTAILALVAAPLANAYEDMRSNADLSSAMNEMPRTNHIVQNLPKYEVIWGFITVIAMFGMARMEGYV